MRKVSVLLAGMTVAGGLAISSTAASADDLAIQSCYGHASNYSKAGGEAFYPSSYPGGRWLTTSANCGDINLRPKTASGVKVCFDPASGSPYCQSSFTLAHANVWNVIARDVVDGIKFKFYFVSNQESNGQFAA
ncbi:hypothetical protein [Kibdelosporangium aridum]|uniref:hypothetical protein n=1 Tax=Kibdelosporangium aridum TaxID=2030 RepID=UPI00052685C1